MYRLHFNFRFAGKTNENETCWNCIVHVTCTCINKITNINCHLKFNSNMAINFKIIIDTFQIWFSRYWCLLIIISILLLSIKYMLASLWNIHIIDREKFHPEKNLCESVHNIHNCLKAFSPCWLFSSHSPRDEVNPVPFYPTPIPNKCSFQTLLFSPTPF